MKVSASVDFFGAGESLEAEASNDFTIGESTTISKLFEWSLTETVQVPPHAGKVYYTAVISRIPNMIPFTATFKRGTLQWEESGEVKVLHGSIFADISSSSQPPSS